MNLEKILILCHQPMMQENPCLQKHKGLHRGLWGLLKNKSLVIALVLSVGIASIGFAWMQEDIIQTQNLPYLGKYSESLAFKAPSSFSLEKMYGTPSPNIEALSARTDSNVAESTSLPIGLEVKALLTKGTASEKTRLTTVIYGPGSIDYDRLETFADVMDS